MKLMVFWRSNADRQVLAPPQLVADAVARVDPLQRSGVYYLAEMLGSGECAGDDLIVLRRSMERGFCAPKEATVSSGSVAEVLLTI
eukprot:1590320-Pyramimonas_sp.AAC.1